MDVARARLMEERRGLQKNRPAGSFAKPRTDATGAVNLFEWSAGIMPAAGSAYAMPEGEALTLTLKFSPDYPAKPPTATFDPPIFHTNVWPTGVVCVSLLLEQGHHPGAGHIGFWQAGLSIGDVLRALVTLLDEPNPQSIANADACTLLTSRGRAAYDAHIRTLAVAYAARAARVRAAAKSAKA